MKKSFLFLSVCAAFCLCVLKSNAQYAMGTDNDGVYYFPQHMAEWCSLDYKDGAKADKLRECFSTICTAYTSFNPGIKLDARWKFGEMKLEAIVNAFIAALDAKKQYANDSKEDKAEDNNAKATDGGREVNAGVADIDKILQMQAHTIDMLKTVKIELEALDMLQDNCEAFVIKKEPEKQ